MLYLVQFLLDFLLLHWNIVHVACGILLKYAILASVPLDERQTHEFLHVGRYLTSNNIQFPIVAILTFRPSWARGSTSQLVFMSKQNKMATMKTSPDLVSFFVFNSDFGPKEGMVIDALARINSLFTCVFVFGVICVGVLEIIALWNNFLNIYIFISSCFCDFFDALNVHQRNDIYIYIYIETSTC